MLAESGYPSVCISIPVYNGEVFLAGALESALGQDYPNLQVIAVDNASTDATRQLLVGVRARNFRAHCCDDHVPVADSWERARRFAQGEFVLLLSVDNVLKPDAVSRLVGTLQAFPGCGFAYGQTTTLHEVAMSRPFGEALRPPRLGLVEDLEKCILQDGYTIAIDSILFRRSLPELYLKSEARNACDLDLLLRLGRAGVVGMGIDEEVLVRREHSHALSQQRTHMWTTSLETLHRHALNSERPHLYRYRIWRTLLWAMVDALQRKERTEAAQYLERFGKNVDRLHRKVLLSLLAFPALGRLPATLRRARLLLG